MKAKIGTCDLCDKELVEIFQMHGNINMCLDCKTDEERKLEQQKAATTLIEQSRVIDSSIQLKQDIYLAKTVPAIELRGAIEADSSILPENKEFAYAQQCMDRFKTLRDVIFSKRAELLELENEMRMWQVNVQTSAGKLRQDLRQQFKELDVNYQPTPITKKQKTTKPTAKPQSFTAKDKAALYEAAKKYGVPIPGLQALKLSRPGKTHDEVAAELAQMMGLSVN